MATIQSNYTYPILFVLCCTFISFSSCTKSNILDPETKLIVNTWVMTGYDREEVANTFTSSKVLVPGKYGYTFYEDGGLIVRHHLGNCSTDPFDYQDLEAQWTYGEKNRIEVTIDVPEELQRVVYATHSLKVIELDADKMIAQIRY